MGDFLAVSPRRRVAASFLSPRHRALNHAQNNRMPRSDRHTMHHRSGPSSCTDVGGEIFAPGG
ncbi:MAG: hypothetical protein IPL78_33835 [Chloroflexi bacterium]|nr:hypothetical protein [Chloroflexota bacterium]